LLQFYEDMSLNSVHHSPVSTGEAPASSPILLIPYMWIGDFVRCHSVVKLLRARSPERPVDMLSTANNAPLIDYMPGLRRAIVCDLPRGRLALRQVWGLAERLRAEHYGTALLMLRTWKSALAPFLAGIPERVGFVGEARFFLLNDLRWGERRLERMIDRCGALALPKGAALPAEWPLPELRVPPAELAEWLARHGLAAEPGPVVVLCPGAIGPGKRWPTEHAAELARLLTGADVAVWVVGSPGEAEAARRIARAGGARVRDLTGTDLRNAILALAAADAAVSNDSGLMHVSAALGTPTVALFGPTSPRLWAPLNPLAAVLEAPGDGTDVRRRKVDDISPQRVFATVRDVLAKR
jgi:lipopolysaccharide heptosyltransferase II